MTTQPLASTDIAVAVGDSITAGTPSPWYTTALAAINAEFPTTTRPYPGVASGPVGSCTGPVGAVAPLTVTPAITWINSGVGGNQAADIAAAVPARITDYNPTAVVLEVGVNDATANVPLASFRASLDSIWTQIKAARPAAKLWALSIYVWGELFNAGPIWANPYDGPPDGGTNGVGASIPDYNAEINASVESFGGLYVETRDEALALIASLSSPPGAHVGPTTIDGLHPNLLGQTLMSDRLLTTVEVVP